MQQRPSLFSAGQWEQVPLGQHTADCCVVLVKLLQGDQQTKHFCQGGVQQLSTWLRIVTWAAGHCTEVCEAHCTCMSCTSSSTLRDSSLPNLSSGPFQGRLMPLRPLSMP